MIHPDGVPGWLLPGEGEALAHHAHTCPGPWVEVGSYCGKSTLWLAVAARHAGVTLFTVDPHMGNPEMEPGRECRHEDVWSREHGSLSVLMDTVAEVRDVVVPVVGTSEQFASTGVRPGFCFIDAFHEYEGVRADFDLWGPLVAPGGTLAFHDSDVPAWGPGVVVREAQAEGWTLVEQVRSLAVLTR